MSSYQKFWKVSRNVFKFQDAAKDYYLTPDTDALCRRLLYFCETGEPVILVGGAHGYGKTALADYIQTQLPVDQFEIIDVRALEPIEKRDWLWPRFATYFGKAYRPASEPTLMDFLVGCLDEISEEQRHLVIVIDDAQNLSTPESLHDIHMLAALHGRVKKCFSMLLFADTSAPSAIGHDDFGANLTYATQLQPWSSQNIQDFIKSRVLTAGLAVNLFSQDALNIIERASAGVPGKVTAIAEHCLMEAYITNNRSITGEIALRATAYVTKLASDLISNPQTAREEPIQSLNANVSFRDLLRTKKPAG